MLQLPSSFADGFAFAISYVKAICSSISSSTTNNSGVHLILNLWAHVVNLKATVLGQAHVFEKLSL
jgi:hypothetical protein